MVKGLGGKMMIIYQSENKFSRLKVLMLCGSIIACLQLVWIGLKNIRYGYSGTLLISSTDADFWASWHTAAANSSSVIDVDKITIASCARDVFFPLHRVSDDNGRANNCRGMLVRDDIIITSRECSKYNYTFNVPGLGILEAMPHISLNSKTSNSRLDFLETTAPYHYYSIYQPVRRIRMFLGRYHQSNKDTIIECDEENRPIAHNFPITNNELVPLHELEGILPNDILWDDDIPHTTMSIEQTNNSTYQWWQRAVSMEEEEDIFEQILHQYKGPRGSIYIPDIANLCEVIDPRGHRSYCFRKYRKEWKREEPFSGQHFFEWLDYGAGRQALQHKRGRNKDRCNKMSCELPCFDKRIHQYLDDEEVVKLKMYITPSQDGRDLIARYKHNDELVPESGDDNDNAYTYMWNLNRSFYITPGEAQHMTLLSGHAALSGGKLYIGKNGRLWGINYSSGHYKPEIRAAAMMYQDFKDKGYNTSALYWIGRAGRHAWSTRDCQKTEWERIDNIIGFNTTTLNQSCHELTVSDTWILKDDV